MRQRTASPRLVSLALALCLAVAGCTKTDTGPTSQGAAAAAVTAAAANTAGVPQPEDLVFELASEKLPADQTQLINGVEVTTRMRDWPTVVITPLLVQTPEGPRYGKCTGTLVGPGVVLLAAHCLDQRANSLRTAHLKVDGVTIAMTCAVHPDYLKPPSAPEPSPRRSEDYALCYANTQAQLPTLNAMRFEVVDTRPVARDAAVLMMGYGCTDLDADASDEILRIGNAKISRAAGGPGSTASDIAYAQIASHGPPQPALCPGDSGGPLITGATVAQQTLPRRVRGVNSSIQRVPAGLLSRISMLSDPRFASWASGWISQFPRAYICGLPTGPATRSCRI